VWQPWIKSRRRHKGPKFAMKLNLCKMASENKLWQHYCFNCKTLWTSFFSVRPYDWRRKPTEKSKVRRNLSTPSLISPSMISAVDFDHNYCHSLERNWAICGSRRNFFSSAKIANFARRAVAHFLQIKLSSYSIIWQLASTNISGILAHFTPYA
jgi:hypothetical protein